MLNLLAGGILFLCFAYIGLQIKRHFKLRLDLFADLIAFCDLLADEVSFLKTPLPKILQSFCEERRGCLTEALKNYGKFIAEGREQTPEELAKTLNFTRLKPVERDAVLAFFAGLGKTDAKTQLMSLKNYRSKFETHHKEAEKKYKTTGLLAYKLGILAGIAALIFTA
jgi:stage III sporulation protein AB